MGPGWFAVRYWFRFGRTLMAAFLFDAAPVRFAGWCARVRAMLADLFDLRVDVAEPEVNEGGCLYVLNHPQSSLLELLTACLVPDPLFVTVKRRTRAPWDPALWAGRWAEAADRIIYVEPALNREERAARFRRDLDRCLRRGRSVVVFPEGGMQPSRALGAFKPAAFEVAAALNVSVVPVATDPVRGFPRLSPGIHRVWFGPRIRSDDPAVLRTAARAWMRGKLHHGF